MQNVVQTSIKIATEVKECADRQKKAILICLHLRLAGKCRFNARSVVYPVVMIPMLHAKRSI